MMPEEPASAGEPNADQPSRVQAACSDSGPIDLVYQIEHQQLQLVVETFMGGPLEGARRATYKRASPSSYVNEKLPPLLLLYGETDEQVDVRSADALVAGLSAAGHKQISYFRLAGVGHCPHSIVPRAVPERGRRRFFHRRPQNARALEKSNPQRERGRTPMVSRQRCVLARAAG